jgi:hypothetical protein
VKAIFTCHDTHCAGPCSKLVDTTDGGTDAGDGGTDAGDGGTDAGDGGLRTCGTKTGTGGTECDKCTESFCCTEWRGCFGDMECNAYDDCVQACLQATP